MTPGIGFAILAMLCFGASDLIYKRAAAIGAGSREFAMLQAWFFCPGVTLYAWLSGNLNVTLGTLWGVLAGLFLLVAVINFMRSLQEGAVSTNAPIFRLNFAVTVALAVLLLGETLSVTKIAALVAAPIAVWLLLAEPGPQPVEWKPLLRVIIAAVAMGCGNFCYKVGLINGAPPETMISAQAWLFCPAATLLFWESNPEMTLTRGAWRYASAAAVVLIIGMVGLLHGLKVGFASVLVPVAQMGFVVTALLGAVIFRERLNARKYVGLAVALAALALFAVS
ncbi:MAG: DMT family transporter [Pseudolabrys sp.]|nr:DMT family transporter [Pseudolabrys sp.]